jgi:hypothetical protein
MSLKLKIFILKLKSFILSLLDFIIGLVCRLFVILLLCLVAIQVTNLLPAWLEANKTNLFNLHFSRVQHETNKY